MDIAALKNLDIKDIFSKIKTGGGANIFKDKKTLIKFGVVGGSILIFLIIYYAFVSPKIDAQKMLIKTMNENKDQINEFLSDESEKSISILKATIKKLRPEYDKSSKLFHSRKEVEDLYQNISNFAMTNGLSIINIEKGEPKAVNENQNSDGQTENTQENQENQENQASPSVLYYKIPVNYKIQGNYLGYLKFRRALSKSNKVINFDKEIITVQATNSSGMILSEGIVSIVGLPDEYNK